MVVILVTVRLVEVLAILVVLTVVKKLSVDDCQLFTVPVNPGSVNVVEFDPAQTFTLPPEIPEVGAPLT